MTDNSQASKSTKKGKRGRKLTDINTYHFESEKKIMGLQQRLKTEKHLSNDEKQKLRNQISAQRSRQNKKQETLKFETQINKFAEHFQVITQVLDARLTG